MTWRIEAGDCLERMRDLPLDSIDAVVTDPPYGIGFMGHDWDQPGDFGPVRANGEPAPFAGGRRQPGPHGAGPEAALERQMARSARRATQRDPATGAGHEYEREHHRRNTQGPGGKREGARFGGPAGERHTGDGGTSVAGGAMHAGRYDLSPTANRRFQAWCEAWAFEALRVLKPGGYLVSFGGTRTYHRMVAGIEDAGFEIRDQLAWLFGSGFPKSRNLGDGWGTALKPGHEPILLARKPLAGTTAANVEIHGTGGINIDACRIPLTDQAAYERNHSGDRGHDGTRPPEEKGATDMRMGGGSASGARWPANVLLDEAAAAALDEQTGTLTSGANPTRRGSDKFRDVYGDFEGQEQCEPARGVDRGGASRFFYCAKTSRKEREAGVDTDERPLLWSNGTANAGSFQGDGTKRSARNHHPTVKPIALMRWLCRLVTPPGGAILDPFTGSGSTGCAAVLEGFDFTGIEREAEYVAIAESRIAYWLGAPQEEAA